MLILYISMYYVYIKNLWSNIDHGTNTSQNKSFFLINLKYIKTIRHLFSTLRHIRKTLKKKEKFINKNQNITKTDRTILKKVIL